MWSLTLPQVAATLAATLVAYRTFNAAGQPLLDSRMLNGVLIMVLVVMHQTRCSIDDAAGGVW